MFNEFMPALHKAHDEITCFGLQNIDELKAKQTYNELIEAQIKIYNCFIKPYAERINVLEEEERKLGAFSGLLHKT